MLFVSSQFVTKKWFPHCLNDTSQLLHRIATKSCGELVSTKSSLTDSLISKVALTSKYFLSLQDYFICWQKDDNSSLFNILFSVQNGYQT
jgi:hypothetical protein